MYRDYKFLVFLFESIFENSDIRGAEHDGYYYGKCKNSRSLCFL